MGSERMGHSQAHSRMVNAVNATTGKRPDGIMFSDKLKPVMWLKLTSQWEENLTESFIRKKSSYNKLESECRSKGWLVIPLYVEVGALGHISTTWGMVSKALGTKKNESKQLRLKCTKIALRRSYHIYQCRKLNEWVAPPLIQY